MDKCLATMEQLDMMERAELRRFAERTEYNRRVNENTVLAMALQYERQCRRRERRKHREELSGMMTFIGVISFLCVMVCCALSSVPWTAILAILCAVAVMWKGGWIG